MIEPIPPIHVNGSSAFANMVFVAGCGQDCRLRRLAWPLGWRLWAEAFYAPAFDWLTSDEQSPVKLVIISSESLGGVSVPLLQPRYDGSEALRWHPWSVGEPVPRDAPRWWPGADWPSERETIVIEDRIPDEPVEVVNWRELGGFFDMCI